jgi:GntR family transcriptional regulator
MANYESLLTDIRLDFRAEQPIYIQIVEQIRALINSGKLQAGEQLPPVRQIANRLKVNFNTVARAYRILDRAGVISTQHGRGTFVWEKTAEENAHSLRQQELHEMAQKFVHYVEAKGYRREEILTAIYSLPPGSITED